MDANFIDRQQMIDFCGLDIQQALEFKGLGGPKRTKIIMKDHDTQKVLGVFENKILVPGSQITACKQFGISPTVIFPTYNSEIEFENDLAGYPTIQPYNTPITCLWCAGRSGAGSSANEINVVSITDRIDPSLVSGTVSQYNDIVPFRYVAPSEDLDSDQRQIYYGRKVFSSGTSDERIGYFFKTFDTTPQLHIRYLDGTSVTKNMYSIDTSQAVECYIELRLSISRLDFRDYFDEVLGWDYADISTISLCSAWYRNDIAEDKDAEEKVYYKWYQDIIPFSKFNFGQEQLTDLNRAIDFNYQIYY